MKNKEYIKYFNSQSANNRLRELFWNHISHQEAYTMNGIDGLLELEDEISEEIITIFEEYPNLFENFSSQDC
ncbi:MAG: hypothetical protein ACD_20C00209G0011 [uncultured bacterium]|nr:MAG: hypothetical protein ACD_20C00209G0011 [uncultured bacterium]